MSIDPNVHSLFEAMIGQKCCRQRVGRGRSLSLGFGRRMPHSKPKTIDSFYGEWELGTYSAMWRIIREGKIVCGSSELVDSIDELDELLQTVELGAVQAVEMLSQFDIRIVLTGDAVIDFMSASTEDDELFHIFGPENLYVEYTCTAGWCVGNSNAPWPPGGKS